MSNADNFTLLDSTQFKPNAKSIAITCFTRGQQINRENGYINGGLLLRSSASKHLSDRHVLDAVLKTQIQTSRKKKDTLICLLSQSLDK